MFRRILFLLLVAIPFCSFAQTKSYTTQKLASGAPGIDGKLDDECWKQATWEGNFAQFEPYEDSMPSQKTNFAILYDDNNLYIAIKAYDTEPDKINKRLSRRDDDDGDRVCSGNVCGV